MLFVLETELMQGSEKQRSLILRNGDFQNGASHNLDSGPPVRRTTQHRYPATVVVRAVQIYYQLLCLAGTLRISTGQMCVHVVSPEWKGCGYTLKVLGKA